MEIEIEKSMDLSCSKLLEKETSQLNLLRDNLNRSSQVANNMETILNSFDHRLARLEMTILPVYQQTGNLQRRQQNTEKTLQLLDYVIGFYNVAGEVESIIRERPDSIGISAYLKAMDDVTAACKFFEVNNPQASELENVKLLYDKGCQQLSIEFRDQLKKYQTPLPAHMTLALIDTDESELTEDILESIELIPMHVREDLRNIASWLDSQGTADRLTVYAKQRAYVLTESLKTLRIFQRSSSGDRGVIPFSQAAMNSPALSRSKGSKIDVSRLSTASARATRALLRAIPVQTSNRRQGTPGGGEEILDESDVAVYLNQVSALHRLSFCEFLLAKQLVPADKLTLTFELIIRDSIHELAVEGENLSGLAHKSVSRGDIQAVMLLLTLLKHMTLMQNQYNVLLSSCQASYRAKFSAILNTLQDTTAKALESFVSSLRNENERALPKDGTVHEQTSNALVFCQQLIDFAITLAPILQKESMMPDQISSHSAKVSLGSYIRRVLSKLGFALIHRSSSYNDATLCAIFRLNNYNYVLKALKSSQLLAIVTLVEPECAKNYKDLILEQKRTYSECLRKLLQCLDTTDDTSLSSSTPGKLRDRERQSIKDRFAGFNKEVEEMQRVQRGYSIPDLELRESIKRDNKEQILPKYQAFYDRFSQVSFSKAPEKYIKYTPSDISNKLDEFFDVAA